MKNKNVTVFKSDGSVENIHVKNEDVCIAIAKPSKVETVTLSNGTTAVKMIYYYVIEEKSYVRIFETEKPSNEVTFSKLSKEIESLKKDNSKLNTKTYKLREDRRGYKEMFDNPTLHFILTLLLTWVKGFFK